MKYHELGIFFVMKGVSRKKFAVEAWEIFMKYCGPEMLKNSRLFHGEASAISPGHDPMFCIAVRTADLEAIEYLKEIFGQCEDERLAPLADRIRESDIVTTHKLERRGKVDGKGRLEVKEWNRVDHDLCKAAGWPYFPLSRPSSLSEEQHGELDMMSEPGIKMAEVSVKSAETAEEKEPGAAPPRKKKRRKASKLPPIVKRSIWGVVIVLLIALSAIGWVRRERIVDGARKWSAERNRKQILGREGNKKWKDGWAMVKIPRVPPDFPLKALNERLERKHYFVFEHIIMPSPDPYFYKPLVHATMTCNMGLRLNNQAYVEISIQDLNGKPIWTDMAVGAMPPPESGKETEDLKRRAFLAAVDDLDIANFCFDGKNFRKRGGFPSPDPLDPDEVKERFAKRLRAEMCQQVRSQWIMSHRLHLKNGAAVDAIVLKQKPKWLVVRDETSRKSFPLARIAMIEPFDRTLFAEAIGESLKPLRANPHNMCSQLIDELGKAFIREETREKLSSLNEKLSDKCKGDLYQHIRESVRREIEKALPSLQKDFDSVCDQVIGELSEDFAENGPTYPEAYVAHFERSGGTGEWLAVVETEKGTVAVKKGDVIDGFVVVEMDPNAKTVHVKGGEGGQVIRICPKPAPTTI